MGAVTVEGLRRAVCHQQFSKRAISYADLSTTMYSASTSMYSASTILVVALVVAKSGSGGGSGGGWWWS